MEMHEMETHAELAKENKAQNKAWVISREREREREKDRWSDAEHWLKASDSFV